MNISLKFLDSVQNVNSFDEVNTFSLIQGNAYELHFRLFRDGLRYVPAVGATISVKFDNIDTNKVITRSAAMAFSADDRSIWKVLVLATDSIAPNSMSATLTEGSTVTKLVVNSSLLVQPLNGFFC